MWWTFYQNEHHSLHLRRQKSGIFPEKIIYKKTWNALTEVLGTDDGPDDKEEFIELGMNHSRYNMQNLMQK